MAGRTASTTPARVTRVARRGTVALAAALAVVVAMPGSAYAHHRIGTEPFRPYAQPATPPMRGCQTVAPPATPTGSPSAVQVIYAWHAGDGNNYEVSVERIARVVDRIDWLIDESSNYDHHLRLSCRYTPDGTYASYARALVVPEQIEAGANPFTSSSTIRSDLGAAGYTDSNRWYLVFTDFESESNATLCFAYGGCIAITELWDAGVAGHELLHALGAGHAWMGETGQQFCPDIMMCWDSWWFADGSFSKYYDPSEPAAYFHYDPAPAQWSVWNIARSPALTPPICCDVGASSDLLTAHERTVDSNDSIAPGEASPAFAAQGHALVVVTPSCGRRSDSCVYFDGRKSLKVTTTPLDGSGFALTRRPAVVAGHTYKLYIRLRSDVWEEVALSLRWYDAAGTLISDDSTVTALTPNWLEHRHQATAPANAASVEVRVVTPYILQLPFGFHVDSLQLSDCAAGCRVEF